VKSEEVTNKAIEIIEDGTVNVSSGSKAIFKFITKKYFQMLTTFSEERFIYRLNLFSHNKFKTDEDVENFWKSIDSKNKSTLLNLISKAMTVTEDIQAFILAQLFRKLEIEGKLTYLDKVLFSNIELLVEEDFEILCFYTKKNKDRYNLKSKSLKEKIKDKGLFSEQIIKKFIVLGILIDKSTQNTLAMSNNIGSLNSPEKVIIKFQFSFTDFSFELMEYLEKYFEKCNVDVIKKYEEM